MLNKNFSGTEAGRFWQNAPPKFYIFDELKLKFTGIFVKKKAATDNCGFFYNLFNKLVYFKIIITGICVELV